MPDYANCYAALAVTPETEWKTVRAQYKRLMGRWHPDRNADRRAYAEDRSKEITAAYRALERYHREYGVLPPLEAPAATGGAERARAPAAAGPRAAEAAVEASAAPGPRRRRRYAVAVATVAAAILGARLFVGPGTEEDAGADIAPPDRAAARSASADPAPGQHAGIGIGSTLGEVYSIQGVPSSTEGDAWYYGKSSIRFANGRVTRWDEHPDFPLRIDRRDALLLEARLFGVGSSKEQVRAAQGAPATETETVWTYGGSRVYFQNERVVHWDESPLQPLRAAR
jgi:DnaJ-like protein